MLNWPTQAALSYFRSRSSWLLHGPVTVFTHQDGSTLFSYWQQSKGRCITRQGVSPIKNQTLNYEWAFWFNKLRCVNSGWWRRVFGCSSAPVLNGRRGIGKGNSKPVVLIKTGGWKILKSQKCCSSSCRVSMVLHKFMDFWFEAESRLLLSSECWCHTCIQQ